MKIGPKYKIARRLGAPVFEKTQTQKFAIAESKKGKGKRGRPRQISDYGLQLIEKQKARYFYCLSEKQFRGVIEKARGQQKNDPAAELYRLLESRLDSVLTKAGFAPSRLAVRQLISHGHIMVNGRRVTIPSYHLKPGQTISLRPQSAEKGVFHDLDSRLTETQPPAWIKLDHKNKTVELKGEPTHQDADLLFDIHSVLEFYSR